MSKDAVEAALHAPDISSAISRRDATLLSLPYTRAVGVGETRLFTWDSVRLESRQACIVISSRRGGRSPSRGLCVPQQGHGGMLSETAIDKCVKLHASKAHKVPVDAFCHMLRHAKARKASHLAEDGMNIYEVQYVLGHASPVTTACCIDVSMAQKAVAIATIAGEREGRCRGSGSLLMAP